MHYNKLKSKEGKRGDLTKDQDLLLSKIIDEKVKMFEKLENPEYLKEQQERKENFKKLVKEKYEKFISDFRLVGKPIVPEYAIIEVFFVLQENKTEGGIILTEEAKESTLKVYPIAKVLESNSDLVKKGEIVSIPYPYTMNEISKEWIQYQKDLREQPTLSQTVPEPPMYVGKLNEWVNYIYKADPFEEQTKQDTYTFCLPIRMLQAHKI